MNEKIKQLAEQAWQYGRENSKDGIGSYSHYTEKFAELIVKECLERLRKEMDQYDLMPGREVSAQTMETAQVLLKNHFGVEE
jgi:hypothetical protein